MLSRRSEIENSTLNKSFPAYIFQDGGSGFTCEKVEKCRTRNIFRIQREDGKAISDFREPLLSAVFIRWSELGGMLPWPTSIIAYCVPLNYHFL